MRNLVIKTLVVLSLGLAGAHFGVTSASAEQPVDKGKRDIIPNLDLPYGVEKKYEFTPGTGYETNKSVPDKFQRQVDLWNETYKSTLGCEPNCPPTTTQTSATAIVVCPTSLTDEEMRLCLGLPAPKKAVRVKRLNVQIGNAE